ncbi:type IV toxin-antitoxin system AbiEi family antitoxin domain-containing protein [Pseudonocardia asaccharolytica]|uniref:type IV toxin-antitoxin system AbiEi family antitoxin domain-containing protein n=1 Tax=Pseudonocardia asaccharolytica TaxID=54010 RepID=UPI0013787FBD
MRLEHLVERQAGVLTLAQALACGMSADTVQRRVRDGLWTRLHPRAHLVGGHRLTDEARVWAAWLWTGVLPQRRPRRVRRRGSAGTSTSSGFAATGMGDALVRGGWVLMRFTWHDLANEPARVLAAIRPASRIASMISENGASAARVRRRPRSWRSSTISRSWSAAPACAWWASAPNAPSPASRRSR